MNPSLIIARKRDGECLANEEIEFFVHGYAQGYIPDYQMSALAMAIYLRGMEPRETAVLTAAMLASGETLLRSSSGRPVVDKHSTGGVGDKVSLVLAPLLACCDLEVPMISGRGLGASGGTLDKLQAIPGFRTDLTIEEIRRQAEQVGCVIAGSTEKLVPADRKLYALRDVTATVASIPLITASIMSKKLAEKLDALVLDVKVGSGAFMKSLAEAAALSESMVRVGEALGLKTSALITDMHQPLGRMAGNAVEVNESVDALAGAGPEDLVALVVALGAELLMLVGQAATTAEAEQRLAAKLASGEALEKFREMVAAQGGDLDAPRKVAPATEIVSEQAGYVTSIHTEKLGQAIVELGGGRKLLTDRINTAVGLEMLVRLGQKVERGEPLLRIFAASEGAAYVAPHVKQAITIGEEAIAPPPLIHQRIEPGQA